MGASFGMPPFFEFCSNASLAHYQAPPVLDMEESLG
jgi:hypothetical protein